MENELNPNVTQYNQSRNEGASTNQLVTADAQVGVGNTVTAILHVNGSHYNLNVDPRATLLDTLREQLKLTGTKKGCAHGQCGACTVHLNGERVLSCLTLAIMQQSKEIVTIEGLAHHQGDILHPMQQAFIEHDAFQCGYCTSGQIMSAVALLAEAQKGAPSHVTLDMAVLEIGLNEEEIRERMSGNICRCGAYNGIIAAIEDVRDQQIES